jgi:hypothetical protein
MTVDRYICCNDQRRTLLTKPPADAAFTGIDYIEVRTGESTLDPVFIDIVLVNAVPAGSPPLTTANFALSGGIRHPAPQDFALDPLMGDDRHFTLRIASGQLTDFSNYRLSVVRSADNAAPPTFFDPRLAAVDFSFKIGCASDYDCAPDCGEDDDALPADPSFDYRVRDYQGFRRLMLDRLATLVPGFRSDDPVDFTTTLVEALAYRADQLSYKLDWVGTEAFLSTARSRTSIARHARLVDYVVGEGASARLFARFTLADAADDGFELPAATPLLLGEAGERSVIKASDYARRVGNPPIIFETVAALQLWSWRDSMTVHSWAADECRLPQGALAITLVDGSQGIGGLTPGDFLLLAEARSPVNGRAEDADPAHRHIVRLTRVTPVTDVLQPLLKLVTVEWDEADALPFDLVIQAKIERDPVSTAPFAEVAANIMLADHGASLPPSPELALTPAETKAVRPELMPDEPPDEGIWRPVLDRGDVARIAPLDLDDADASVPAARLAIATPGTHAAALQLDDDFRSWTARPDLLESTRYSRDFVVEQTIDGRVALRPGDDVHGLRPTVGMRFSVSGRFGCGTKGNIGADAIGRLVLKDAEADRRIAVTNPLAARGGADPEPVNEIRINAPVAFRRQERAVVADDYAHVARQHPGVADAAAVPMWTGAWQTIMLYIDRKGGAAVDAAFRADLLRHMENYRLIGFDIAVRAARLVPLDIELMVCVAPHALRSHVAAELRAVLRPGSGDRPGFFHPDKFDFGAPLYLSRLVAAAMAVEGVESVTARKFQRFGRIADGEIAAGVIKPGALEVLQLSDDPSFPEQGRLGLVMGGGR